MKADCFTIVAAVFLFPIVAFAQGRLTLNAGESYAYEFTSLPLTGPGSPSDLHPTFGMLTVSFSSSSQSGVLKFELYEGSALESPVGSVNVGVPAMPQRGVFVQVDGIWQDLHGTVRLSALSGAITLEQVRATVQRSEVGGPFLYSAILPIPEPNASALCFVGSILFLIKNYPDEEV